MSKGFIKEAIAITAFTFALTIPTESLAQPTILKEYKSLYRNITVLELPHSRCVRLKNKKNPFNSQSCLRLSDPKQLMFFYSQAMMAALSTQKSNLSVLSVGLGGGTMPSAIHSYFDNANVITVELDPKMLEAAQDYMQFKPSDKNQVAIQDARYFIRKQGLKNAQYDVVLLDAFNGEYIPEHLTTKEFLQEVKMVLKPGGMLLSNTFSYQDFYHSESATYQSVFPDFCAFRSAGTRTVVAYNGHSCDKIKLTSDIEKNLAKLAHYIHSPKNILETLTDKKDWDTSAQIFTDEFSPANLYNSQ